MSEVRTVSSAEIEAYHEMIASLARRYNGHCGAEYDDLFQEGSLVVFYALRKSRHPSKDIVARRMRDWVAKCRREGRTGFPELVEDLDALLGE